MIQDDKIGIGYSPLCILDDPNFLTFDGKKWTLNEERLKAEDEAIAKAGANFKRIIPWGVWGKRKYGKRSQFQPYILNEAKDKWDLEAFNTYYFPIVEKIFTIANDVGLTVLWDWFDNCQFHGGYVKYSPWANNTQDITTFYGQDADAFTRRWIATWLVRAERYSWDVIWGFGNELNNSATPDMAKRVIFPIVKNKKLDFNRLTYGAVLAKLKYFGNHEYEDKNGIQDFVKKDFGMAFGDDAKCRVTREVHGCASPAEGAERPFGADTDQALVFWGKNPIRKMFSDDGTRNGDSKCDTIVYAGKVQTRPSATTWGKMASFILQNYPTTMGGIDRLISFEHLPKSSDLACQVATIKAISTAYHTKWGIWPKNWGKHPS